MGTCAFDKLFSMNVPHILERIFFSLDYHSFKICMHVSTTWSDLLMSEPCQNKAKSVFRTGIQKDNKRLWRAARSGNVCLVRQLLSNFLLDINHLHFVKGYFLRRKTTSLFEASWKGHEEVVKILLAAGADINKTDHQGQTALHIASFKDHTHIVDLLLDRGADPNVVDVSGQTALHDAAWWGHKNMVKILLAREAVIDVTDDMGWTPLKEAVSQGQTSVVKLLLEKGACPKTSNGPISLDGLALRMGNMEIMKLLRQSRARSI